jgi:hypothetical protein
MIEQIQRRWLWLPKIDYWQFTTMVDVSSTVLFEAEAAAAGQQLAVTEKREKGNNTNHQTTLYLLLASPKSQNHREVPSVCRASAFAILRS